MPVGFTVTSDGVSIGDVVRPGVHIVRGMDIGEVTLTPRASTCAFVADDRRNIAVGDELVVTAPGGPALFTGKVRDVSVGKDRNNVRRYHVSADGRIADLVSAGRGYSSDYLVNLPANQALVLLLERAGVGVAGRDVGASARDMALFYVEEAVPLWQQVLTVVRTAGPRARLFERGDGVLRFRDEAVPAVSRAVRGRLGAGSGGIVSAVLDDEAGRERIVNVVDLSYASSEDALAQVAQVWGTYERDTSISDRDRTTSTITTAQLTSAGVVAGDTVIVLGGARAYGGAHPVTQSNTLSGWAAGLVGTDGTPSGYLTWPSSAAIVLRTDAIGANPLSWANTAAVIVRGGAVPAELTAGAVESGTLMIAYAQIARGRTLAGSTSTDNVLGVTPPDGWTLMASTPTGNRPLGQSRSLAVAFKVAGSGETLPNLVRFGVSYEHAGAQLVTAEVLGVAQVHTTLWQESNSYTIAPDQTLQVAASSAEPFGDVVSPVEGTDYQVDAGSIDIARVALLRTPTSVTILYTAGASGATISDLQLRGSGLVRDMVSTASAQNAASIATWGRRSQPYSTWPLLDRPNAQALADEIAAYGAQPRRTWRVQLDADRDVETLAAALGAELGDVLTCNIDSDLSQDGEVVRIEHFIGTGETLETSLTLLATVAGLAPPSTATAPGKPLPPVLTSSAPSFAALWVAPDDGGSPITFYTFRYREQGTAMWIESSVGGLSTNISNLKTNTTYEAQVRATNVVGDGPFSDSGFVTTAALAGLLLTTGGHLLLTTGGSLELEG